MNILFVTAYDSMGQQFNGYALQKELLKRGHQSNMFVFERLMDDPNVHLLGGEKARFVNRVFRKIEHELSLQSVLPTLGNTLIQSQLFKNADIVHLQLLHARQFFSLLNLPAMSKQRKILWTIHDPWLTTGHCIHPLDCQRWLTGCGHCPDLKTPLPIKRDTTALNWKIKNWVMQRSNVHLIAASEWMADRFRTSPILSHLPYSVIPFGVDTDIFHPTDKREARAYFNIPDDADVITFRWAPYFGLKGPEYIKKALEMLELRRETYVITMDAPSSYGLVELQSKYHFVDLEWVEDRKKAAMALNAADVFLMPSLAESFGLMAVEAMACGTPVIVFQETALASVIHAPHAGIAVPFKDSEALANAVDRVLADASYREELVRNALQVVQSNYTMECYTQNHIDLYSEIALKPLL